MKRSILFFFALLLSCGLMAQSEVTRNLQTHYNTSVNVFFYRNTLKMLNISDSKEFDNLVENVEKVKVIGFNKTEIDFPVSAYKKLLKEYKTDSFEPVLTTRLNGKNFDILIKEKKGAALGTIVLVNDSTSLYVVDVLGSVDISKLMKYASDPNNGSGAFTDTIMKMFNNDEKMKRHKHKEEN